VFGGVHNKIWYNSCFATSDEKFFRYFKFYTFSAETSVFLEIDVGFFVVIDFYIFINHVWLLHGLPSVL